MTDISKNTELQQSCITAVKSRFFAQYYGQEILRWHQWIETTNNGKVDLSIPAIEKEGWFIELKHLSQINDEDCIFIGTNILAIPTGLINYEHKVVYVKNVITNQLNKNITHIGKENVIYSNFYLLDFLRSKGYAVPFMEYSIDDLISFGWVQLL